MLFNILYDFYQLIVIDAKKFERFSSIRVICISIIRK